VRTRQLLGVAVEPELVAKWRGWYAPTRQAFRTDLLAPDVAAIVPANEADPIEEWRDTFFMYGGTWTWLDEAEFGSLPRKAQRGLQAVRRKVIRPKPLPVWESELARSGDQPMFDWIQAGVRWRRQRRADPGRPRTLPSLAGRAH
jgi:hypothetical protein